MAFREPQAAMDETGATEPKETWVVQGRLYLGDRLVSKERKEIREILEFRAPPVKKDSEGKKGRVELQDHPAQLPSHMNGKECTWNDGDDKDQGLIKVGR